MNDLLMLLNEVIPGSTFDEKGQLITEDNRYKFTVDEDGTLEVRRSQPDPESKVYVTKPAVMGEVMRHLSASLKVDTDGQHVLIEGNTQLVIGEDGVFQRKGPRRLDDLIGVHVFDLLADMEPSKYTSYESEDGQMLLAYEGREYTLVWPSMELLDVNDQEPDWD